MAWHTRGATRSYYRSRRIGHTVRRQFVARGMAGEVAEQLDRSLREERIQRAATLRQHTESLNRLSRAHSTADAALMVHIRGHMIAAGFYQHHRSDWRRRAMSPTVSPSPVTLRFPTSPTTTAEWRELVDQANAGDATALARVRELLKRQPAVVNAAADLEQITRGQALDLVSSTDLVLREALLLKVQSLETELSGPKPAPALQAAAKRAALAWLVLQVSDLHCAEQLKSGTVPKRWLDVQEASERRYAAALKLVETIRGLIQRKTSR